MTALGRVGDIFAGMVNGAAAQPIAGKPAPTPAASTSCLVYYRRYGYKGRTIPRHIQEKEITMSNHHWNDWAGGLTLVLQAIVYIPLLYIILMPWLCLALVKLGRTPFFPGFFQAMASAGWLVASGLVGLVVLFVVVRSLVR
ncbi:hypothetical protein D3C76_784610 [compost metagenome]